MKIKDMDFQEHNWNKENKYYVMINCIKKYFDTRVENDHEVKDDQ